MEVTELLKPRIQLTNDYIGNTMAVGSIFTTGIPEYYLKFSANFRRVEWWEDREEKDMPKYLKWQTNGKVREIEKYRKWFESLKVTFKGGRIRTMSAKWTPCTEEEFSQQSKPQQP